MHTLPLQKHNWNSTTKSTENRDVSMDTTQWVGWVLDADWPQTTIDHALVCDCLTWSEVMCSCDCYAMIGYCSNLKVQCMMLMYYPLSYYIKIFYTRCWILDTFWMKQSQMYVCTLEDFFIEFCTHCCTSWKWDVELKLHWLLYNHNNGWEMLLKYNWHFSINRITIAWETVTLRSRHIKCYSTVCFVANTL